MVWLLVAISVLTAMAVTLGNWEHEPASVAPQADNPIDPNKPAPVAGADRDSKFNRGLHFWTLGDYQQAFPWLKASAEMGHPEARYHLGLAYLYGRGTVRNFRLAFEQFGASARQNDLNAQHQLGLMYRDGVGTDLNREQAYIWLNIVASRGRESASHDRDKLAMSMSEAEVARAQDGTLKELAILGDEAARADQAGTTVMAAPPR